MNFSEILEFLNEQVEDPNDDENQDDPNQPIGGPPEDPPAPEEPPVDEVPPEDAEQGNVPPEGTDDQRTQPTDQDRNVHKKTIKKKLNAVQQTKLNWLEETREKGITITETQMNGAIEFFNTKKNGLRPLGDQAGDIPQLFALKQRFPDFPADNIRMIRDIQTYSWEQIIFFMERYIAEPDQIDAIDEGEQINVRGATNVSHLLDQAYEQWDRQRKIFDQDGVSIVQIVSKQHSINVGFLENCLKDKYDSRRVDVWCTTWTRDSNMYQTYRSDAAFYYVLNRNVPEDNEYRFFSVAASPHGTYRLTNTFNTYDTTGLSFDQVLDKTNCPQLADAKEVITWFEETEKESIERIFDTYTFDGQGENDFMFLTPSAQMAFIEHSRNIRSAKALKSLGVVKFTNQDKPTDLQYEYVRRTTAQNLADRFKTSDPDEDVFDMISKDVLRPKVRKFLDEFLKTRQGVPDGLFAVVALLLNNELIKSYKDIERQDIRMFQNKNTTGLFGIFNLDSYQWVKPLEYSKQTWNAYVDRNTKKTFIAIKYVSDNDYFYWLFNKADLLSKDKTNPNYLKGKFVEGDEGDQMFTQWVKIK